MGSQTWRLITDGAADGRWNMAVDRAIQLSRESGESPPTIRVYGWERPTVTLGRFQQEAGIDWEAAERRGVDVVRRFTGGRGVLHDSEMTYSIVASVDDGIPRGTSASYKHLSAGLVAVYQRLGIEAELTDRPRGEAGSAACYLHSTRADLSHGLAKLAGSAQTWVGSTCLQHGSFTISRDIEREAEVFRLDSDAAEALVATTATLETLGLAVPSHDEFAAAVGEGIAHGLQVEIEPGVVTSSEREAAEGLLEEVTVKRAAPE